MNVFTIGIHWLHALTLTFHCDFNIIHRYIVGLLGLVTLTKVIVTVCYSLADNMIVHYYVVVWGASEAIGFDFQYYS